MTKQATPDMFERVARAIRATPSGRGMPEDEAREYARAAIEAMREPGLAIRKITTFEFAEIEWPKLIDAALATHNGEGE